MITDARSDDRSPTSLWVPLYLALRCPPSVTTDPEAPLRMLLEWLYPFAKPTYPCDEIRFLLLNNAMRYTANIAGATASQVYLVMYKEVMTRIYKL